MKPVPCNVCGADDPRPLFDKDGFHIVRCPACAFVYVDPQPEEDDIASLYNEQKVFFIGASEDEFADYQTDKERYWRPYAGRLAAIEQRAAGKGRLLEIGSAGGLFLDYARHQGWQVTGLELSEWGVARTRDLGIDVLQRPLEEADLEPESFDVVVMYDVIEHLPSPREQVRGILRVLKPGGVLVVATPNVASAVAEGLGDRWTMFTLPEHIMYFSPQTLTRLLTDAGYEGLETPTLHSGGLFRTAILLVSALVKVDLLGLKMTTRFGAPVRLLLRAAYYLIGGAATAVLYPWLRRLARTGRAEGLVAYARKPLGAPSTL